MRCLVKFHSALTLEGRCKHKQNDTVLCAVFERAMSPAATQRFEGQRHWQGSVLNSAVREHDRLLRPNLCFKFQQNICILI